MKNQFTYFKECQTLQDVKTQFRKLSKIHHPDLGGNIEVMKIINNEYDIAFNYYQKLDNEMQKQENIKNNKKENYNFNYETSEAFKNMIEKLLNIDIEIEIIGSWLWFKQGSYENKELLKSLNCRFSGKNKHWYWFEGIEKNNKSYYKTKMTMDDKRNIYGSQTLQGTAPLKLQ